MTKIIPETRHVHDDFNLEATSPCLSSFCVSSWDLCRAL